MFVILALAPINSPLALILLPVMLVILALAAIISPLELILPEAVKWPVKFKSSAKVIPPTLPPADSKLFAKTVPEALMSPVVSK